MRVVGWAGPAFLQRQGPQRQPVFAVAGAFRALLDFHRHALGERGHAPGVQIAENKIARAIGNFPAEQDVGYRQRTAALGENDIAFFVDPVAHAVDERFVLVRRADQLGYRVGDFEFGELRVADAVDRVIQAHGKQQLLLDVDRFLIRLEFEEKFLGALVRARAFIAHEHVDGFGERLVDLDGGNRQIALGEREEGDDVIGPGFDIAVDAADLARGAGAEHVELLGERGQVELHALAAVVDADREGQRLAPGELGAVDAGFDFLGAGLHRGQPREQRQQGRENGFPHHIWPPSWRLLAVPLSCRCRYW